MTGHTKVGVIRRGPPPSSSIQKPTRDRRWRKLLLSGAVLAWFVIALPAVASKPILQDVDRSGTAILTDVCPFPIHVSFTQTGTDALFLDKENNLTRVHGHVVEHDVFSANGNVLAGLPYTFNVRVEFEPESGMVTAVYGSGVMSRVPLSDGEMFLTAGRWDFIAAGTSFLVQPDVGARGNTAGFCEALS